MEHLNVTDRFDGAAHWAALTPDDQAAIGAATLERIAADAMIERAEEDDRGDWERVGYAAERACDMALKELFVDTISREALEAADGTPRIPRLLGMVCRACGCSEDDACSGGCGWAAVGLCTACIPGGPADRGGADVAC